MWTEPCFFQAINPNLTAFAGPGHNGKLIQYVGWADQLISPGNSIHYYETVHAYTLANTTMDIDDYYRLFLVPGMNHWCVALLYPPLVPYHVLTGLHTYTQSRKFCT